MKRIFCSVLLLLGLLWGWHICHPALPSPEHPICLWSNQLGDDLTQILDHSLQGTQSADISIYTFTNKRLLQTLSKIPHVCLYADKKCPLQSLFPLRRDHKSGLMHRKIAIIDDHLCLIGSANFTKESLQQHDNLLLGFESRELAQALRDGHGGRFMINGQTLEVFFIPEEPAALERCVALVESARGRLRIAQFHFTHPRLIRAVLDSPAQVEVAIDRACRKTIQLLQKAGKPVYTNKTSLLHHKFALIDDHTLIVGSANWTKGGFHKNREILLILSPLNEEQKTFCRQLWQRISSPERLP